VERPFDRAECEARHRSERSKPAMDAAVEFACAEAPAGPP
jgi:hypothetical protein